MARQLISSGSSFERDIGYSRAVVDGDWVFVSGTTGFDYASMALADGVVAQCEQCLVNIEAALQQAEDKGLIERGLARIRPTERGFDFLSDLQSLFLADA